MAPRSLGWGLTLVLCVMVLTRVAHATRDLQGTHVVSLSTNEADAQAYIDAATQTDSKALAASDNADAQAFLEATDGAASAKDALASVLSEVTREAQREEAAAAVAEAAAALDEEDSHDDEDEDLSLLRAAIDSLARAESDALDSFVRGDQQPAAQQEPGRAVSAAAAPRADEGAAEPLDRTEDDAPGSSLLVVGDVLAADGGLGRLAAAALGAFKRETEAILSAFVPQPAALQGAEEDASAWSSYALPRRPCPKRVAAMLAARAADQQRAGAERSDDESGDSDGDGVAAAFAALPMLLRGMPMMMGLGPQQLQGRDVVITGEVVSSAPFSQSEESSTSEDYVPESVDELDDVIEDADYYDEGGSGGNGGPAYIFALGAEDTAGAACVIGKPAAAGKPGKDAGGCARDQAPDVRRYENAVYSKLPPSDDAA
ncbi:hypothetical protein MNEG_7146 [Monoraphidium neglectum]|uniref:Uncharacterized protein n=1 Tax=Monoraphidium neglectum TaxID=145388 RepID=A0A0D2MC52_9CHLO|nr:hypothetical protein MNEG_7146 [Monoraphidium neglectum]KIZ00815.1 hypothetical protein MNEG_7146 [Monoraphidium neglectum]|eukprot:XP_013899834.1 hypothetical protein MNEG_7146 [Monoraphidium neglectum]